MSIDIFRYLISSVFRNNAVTYNSCPFIQFLSDRSLKNRLGFSTLYSTGVKDRSCTWKQIFNFFCPTVFQDYLVSFFILLPFTRSLWYLFFKTFRALFFRRTFSKWFNFFKFLWELWYPMKNFHGIFLNYLP